MRRNPEGGCDGVGTVMSRAVIQETFDGLGVVEVRDDTEPHASKL
jgi:hypothetical protein